MSNQAKGLIEIDHHRISTESDVYLDGLSVQLLTMFVHVEPEDYKSIKKLCDGLLILGLAEQKSFWALNERMQYPLQKLLSDAKAGGQVTQLMQAIQNKVSQIKPPKQTLMTKFKSMFLLLFSWHETTWDIWLEQYPALKADIKLQVTQLNQQKQLLNADNNKLNKDRAAFEVQINQLENSFDLLVLLASKMQDIKTYQADTSIQSLAVINDEFLPLVEQRQLELQQQLIIARQAMMTIELFIKQNETQLNSIDQMVHTITAVMDVTAGILLINDRQNQLEQVKQTVDMKNTSVDSKKLKQARQVIDQALLKMEDVEQQTKQSTEELLVNSELTTNK